MVNDVGSLKPIRDLSEGAMVGPYRILRRLSAGAQGEVFLVEDRGQHGQLVLKLLSEAVAANALRLEFTRLTELSHPNIVRVHDAGIVAEGARKGRGFMVLDHVAGNSLAEVLASADEARRFDTFTAAAEALADALAYLHGRGVLHGDVSPANLCCTLDGTPVLIDFGLSSSESKMGVSATAVSGTLGFIAPEGLLGERGAAGDVFGLGATLYHAWTGVPPFGLGLQAVERVWQAPPPPPSALRPGLPAVWDELILRTLAGQVEKRPGSARELLLEVRRITPGRALTLEDELSIPHPAGDPLAGLVVGASDEQACLRAHLDRLADGAATVSVVWLAGPPGSGRHTLVRRVLRDARLAMLMQTQAQVQALPAFDVEETSWAEMLAHGGGETPPADEPLGRSEAAIARVITALEERAQARPLCLALAGSVEDQALAEALSGTASGGRLLLIVPCERAKARPGCGVVAIQALTRTDIAELSRRAAGRDAPAQIVEQIATISGGLAGAVALLVRNWIGNVREGKPAVLDASASARDLAGLLDASFARLGHSTRAFLVGVAAGVTSSDAACSEESVARTVGWLSPEARALPSPLHVEAVWRAVAHDAALHQVARQSAQALSASDPRLAELQLASGDREQAGATFWCAMRSASQTRAWGAVAQMGSRALEANSAGGTAEERFILAGALGILGRYQDAVAAIDGCAAQADQDLTTKLVERKAWLLGRQGKTEDARRMVEDTLAQLSPGSDAALLLRGRLARLLVSTGRFADAFSTAEPALQVSSGAAMSAREAAVLALAYGGRLREARRWVDQIVRQVSEPLASARVASLDGLVHQMMGQPALAAEAYQRATEGHEQLGDLHGAAAARFNLGCMRAELGDYGAALEALEHAVRDLGRLCATADQALAIFNVGQLFLQLGDLEAAERSVARLTEVVSHAGVEAFHGYACLLRGEIEKNRRAFAQSVQSYAEAAAVLLRIGMPPMAAIAELGRAEALAELGQTDEARRAWQEVSSGLSASPSQGDPSVSEAALLARARVAILRGELPAGDAAALGETLAAAGEQAKQIGRLPAAWRLAALASQLFSRAGDSRQAAQKAFAKALFSEVAMKTPARYWPAMQAQPEARILDLHSSDGNKAGADIATHVALLESRLRRLLRINKRLNSDLRLSRVLETIIDTVIELTDAERGFLLLKDGAGELAVKVARNIDQTTLEGPGLALSRSIAKQAAETGQPVIAVDAAGDTRFSELLSVSDLHLRSVLAVPLAVKGHVVGTIYVDHRLRKGVFGDDELALVLDFAEQGAIAIENTRIVSELRRREQQVQSLNRRLEHELRVKEAALDDARVELKESRQVAALRYDYRQIVGQSPGMLELFRLLDRVTDTSLPVVVEGESGTGKELVARAIHFHGPRKELAFVSENCAAIPETLLESTLFGHVRGAFTGADRDARGLFAVANGGTLFLDEVAEMSAAMQGKLLRVLQNGEYHRVGSERPEKVDVRVVVATNKNLAQMVEEGKFRKDLFYRLSVVRIHLPPLRERREDIPLLLRHFLDKAGKGDGQSKGVDPGALDKLCSYAWPGNVRELENEIARAGAFATGSISVSDLSPHIQAGQDAIETVRSDSDNLRLRNRVERLERQLIREAMARSQGNQTKAAGLLGLSRFGLQKKLRRYNLGI